VSEYILARTQGPVKRTLLQPYKYKTGRPDGHGRGRSSDLTDGLKPVRPL